MSRPLVACDLDRTLIYSAAALGLTGPDHEAPRLVVAEVHEGRPISYLTRRAAGLIEDLAGAAPLVPVTTRTLGQYRRIRLTDRPPRYAVAANGGHLLVDGRPDPGWRRRVTGRVRRDCATLAAKVSTWPTGRSPSVKWVSTSVSSTPVCGPPTVPAFRRPTLRNAPAGLPRRTCRQSNRPTRTRRSTGGSM
ncbi:hypothetical protein [Actinoplanes philippinensis]|uniref:hypothetical protein n=1 Tax=Actinoplanes philippinensis TaxID=35752 RepID=UPI0033FD61ED